MDKGKHLTEVKAGLTGTLQGDGTLKTVHVIPSQVAVVHTFNPSTYKAQAGGFWFEAGLVYMILE